ncbi:UDP-4-amino-4,6-dideoxy-N-acetyl-beta-L-altrosamine transaminase [Tolumonas lignilytica]|jgi:UDP-4-keto-6-deoxy-N-acetylglucosamine 4-aminotransferase|uniref:UDP-4-amino-4, 6-dideoxy-N-acetyl-beta-L-altrosamine transaminase n=1 Tax=Tolumonas lignilytica TaxID=1283284 RepID=UPI0004662E29|nr:UDP-4-amino-4,6-dideoxy-N-acetyl-beta-L-altrosamine transaminase [Tolumonas lignilytica]
MIPYGKQHISTEDIRAVVEVLNSEYLTQGPAVPAFEQAIENYTGAKFAVAVNSATSALHIACLALGLTVDDWLWTTPNTFVASANCGRYCGANIDFVDIQSDTYNLDPIALKQKLEISRRHNLLPKIVVAVDFAGQSCDWKSLRSLANEYGFFLIEDASHAIGGRYLAKPVGDCSYADITIFSFHPVKIITTAEGGMTLTNDELLAKKMRRLRSHGITRDPAEMIKPADGPWSYQQIELGWNYRMTDIQAALGLSQLKRINEFVAQRHHIAKIYNEALKNLPLTTPYQDPDAFSAYHLYPVVLHDPSKRLAVFNTLRAANIGVNVHYIPVHTQPYYQSLGHKQGNYPIAESYYAGTISLPIYPQMTNDEQDYVIQTIKNALS